MRRRLAGLSSCDGNDPPASYAFLLAGVDPVLVRSLFISKLTLITKKEEATALVASSFSVEYLLHWFAALNHDNWRLACWFGLKLIETRSSITANLEQFAHHVNGVGTGANAAVVLIVPANGDFNQPHPFALPDKE